MNHGLSSFLEVENVPCRESWHSDAQIRAAFRLLRCLFASLRAPARNDMSMACHPELTCLQNQQAEAEGSHPSEHNSWYFRNRVLGYLGEHQLPPDLFATLEACCKYQVGVVSLLNIGDRPILDTPQTRRYVENKG